MNLIYRAKKDVAHPYVMILRDAVYDINLSLKAKGLLCFILSKPDDWQVYVRSIAAEVKEDKNTVSRILNELIAEGYCIRQRHNRNVQGQYIGYDYIFFESKGEKEKWEAKFAE